MTAAVIRSPEILKSAVESLHVETDERYRKRDVTGDGIPETWCNRFVSDVTALLGCPIPYRLASQQLDYLSSLDGADAGWQELIGPTRSIVAIDQAERGIPTIAAWSNPIGHGHIAILVPGQRGMLFIAQAGASNFSCKPIRAGFGIKPYRIFTQK